MQYVAICKPCWRVHNQARPSRFVTGTRRADSVLPSTPCPLGLRSSVQPQRPGLSTVMARHVTHTASTLELGSQVLFAAQKAAVICARGVRS